MFRILMHCVDLLPYCDRMLLRLKLCNDVDIRARLYIVNQLLFVVTFFRNLPVMNWFTVTNFTTDNFLNILETLKDWFTARHIHNDEVLVNLAKISRIGIKVGLQYIYMNKIHLICRDAFHQFCPQLVHIPKVP